MKDKIILIIFSFLISILVSLPVKASLFPYNVTENTSSIASGGSEYLSVNWTRNSTGWNTADLWQAILSTNETGAFVNYTGVYGSPFSFSTFALNDSGSSIVTTASTTFENYTILPLFVNSSRDYLVLSYFEVTTGTSSAPTVTKFGSVIINNGSYNTQDGPPIFGTVQGQVAVSNISSVTTGSHQAFTMFNSQGGTAGIQNGRIFATPLYDYVANTSVSQLNTTGTTSPVNTTSVQLTVPTTGNYLVLATDSISDSLVAPGQNGWEWVGMDGL